MRRHRCTSEHSFYLCNTAAPVALAALVDAMCCRWKIEEDFQAGKDAPPLTPEQVDRIVAILRLSDG